MSPVQRSSHIFLNAKKRISHSLFSFLSLHSQVLRCTISGPWATSTSGTRVHDSCHHAACGVYKTRRVAVTALRTHDDVRYCCRTAKNIASGIAMVTWPRYRAWLFQLRKFRPLAFSLCVVAERCILQQTCFNKWMKCHHRNTVVWPVILCTVTVAYHRLKTSKVQYRPNCAS